MFDIFIKKKPVAIKNSEVVVAKMTKDGVKYITLPQASEAYAAYTLVALQRGNMLTFVGWLEQVD